MADDPHTTNPSIVTPFDPPPAGCEWRIVAANDHYEISEYGHLRRAIGGSNSKKGKLIRGRVNRNGYVQYGLWRDNKPTTHTAHRLTGVAFLPNPQNLPEVAHWDGAKLNCAASNLRWATEAQNSADRIRHGRQARGEQLWSCKLSPDQARAIRSAQGKQRDIASRFGVTQALVWRIKHGHVWKHLWAEERR